MKWEQSIVKHRNLQMKKLVEVARKAADKIDVTVEDQELVPAYQIRIIENVKIQPSPQWLQNLLMNEGIRQSIMSWMSSKLYLALIWTTASCIRL